MGFFKKILGGSKEQKTPKGFNAVLVKDIQSVGADTVKVSFSISEELKNQYSYIPGQYIVLCLNIGGKEYRRSYSICSGENSDLSVAVKKVKDGIVSSFVNNELKAGDNILISKPEGNFILPKEAKKVVLIAAGSGITPIMSMLKSTSSSGIEFQLFYGARKEKDILFYDELKALVSVKQHIYLSGEEVAEYKSGRISNENFTAEIKSDLSILKSDAFMLCGPEEMIHSVSEVLETFGISKSKIHFELFTPPTKEAGKNEATAHFEGNVTATIIIDGDSEDMIIKPGKVILDTAIDNGMDAPYSCKGGVCSTCKGKVLKGAATMKMNYSLSDKEVEEGFILTCQACPTTEEITVTYDV